MSLKITQCDNFIESVSLTLSLCLGVCKLILRHVPNYLLKQRFGVVDRSAISETWSVVCVAA